MTNLAWNGIATGNSIQGKPADPGRNNSLKSDKETQSPLIRVFKEIMDRERGGDNERTNLLNENKNVNRNKIFTFTKYKNENAIGDSSSSEQNCEHPQHFRQKKPGVVRKLEDDFKVYRSRSDHQSKASTPSKKGSWWKWGQSDDRKAISSDSASRISCACKRLMCSDYVVMFILTVFFTFSTLLGLVIIFKAFPSLVIVPADDHLRLNRKVDRLTQLQTDGLIDSSLARNSRVGLKSNDYRSWNNPLPTGDPVNMHSFDDLNIADFRDSNQLAKPENGNSDFYKKLLRTAARYRKIKQNHRDTYDNDFVFGDMNRYKRSIGYPTRKHKRHCSPHAQYHNKVSRKSGNRKASVINKRHSEEPMGVVIEKKQMVLQFLGPHESKINSYHKPYNRWNKHHQKQEQKHISNEKNFQKNYHLTDHVMEKKFTDAAPNGAFSDILRKGKDKFNHFLNHKNGYDFNTFDSFDNSQFDYLKHHELKDIEVNQNKEDTCQDIEKDKIASEKAMSNENPLNKGLSENTGNPTAPSTTENTVREKIERSTETTLELQKSTSAAMEKVPILRKLLQFDENYHEAEDYDHIKTKNKILMNPDLVDDVIVIETNEMDDKIKDAHNNDIEINIGDINDNLESFAEVEAAMIAEDKQSQASLNDNYGVVEIDVDDGFDLLQAYSDYGILQTPSDIGYKDKSKTSSQEEDSKTNMSKAENKTQTFLGNMSEKVKETSSAKRLVAKPYKIFNKLNNGIIRRKLLSINMDHSDTVNNSIVHNINTNTDKVAINEKEIANPEINQNTAKNSTTQILETKSSTTHNETKIVLKRNVPISDKDLIFWDDIYDDDAKSGSKIATQSVKADVNFAKKSDSKSNFGEWISDKLNNVVENIRNGMQRDPIKTNLKVHEVTRSVRDAKIPESTHDINKLDTENKKANKTKREAGKSHEITSFAELEQNMKRICKEAVKAVEDIKNIKVNNKEKHSADGYLNNLLMGQLVSMMSDLVDYQVEQKTCLKLPPDLREFLIWLTSAEEANNKQDPLKTELDELQMDSDLLTSHKPSEPEPGHDPTSASSEKEDGYNGHVDERSECLGTLEDVQELMQEYQSLPEEEKTKMAGVKEYLEKQLDYLYKKLEATQDLNALPVLYTDPLLRKRRNHPNKRVNHPFRPSNHPPQRENHRPQRGNHPRTRVKRGVNKKTMTKSNRHKNLSIHRNSAKIKRIDNQKY